jgi:hypothetical protein
MIIRCISIIALLFVCGLTLSCTTTSIHRLNDWARYVQNQPTTVIPHLFDVGIQQDRLEIRDGDAWKPILQDGIFTILGPTTTNHLFILLSPKTVNPSQLRMITKSGEVWRKNMPDEDWEIEARPNQTGPTIVQWLLVDPQRCITACSAAIVAPSKSSVHSECKKA